MGRNFKIQIPKPCHESWEEMTPAEKGRFCNSCAKNVIDFSNMPTAEIQQYLTLNKNKQICGRFRNEQLESIVISIPKYSLFSQTQFHKIFLLAFFVNMGTTLFSCSNENGNKQTIEKIEIIDDGNSGTSPKRLPEKDSATVGNTKKTEDCEQRMTKGMIVPPPHRPRIKVYKDSITISQPK